MGNKFTDYYRLGGIGGIKLGRENFEHMSEIPWDIQRSLCVNPAKKIIYYKPGKAAGTSIFRVILQPMGGWIIQKDNPKEFSEWMRNITDKEMDKYFTFIFVRNPFDRLVSYWNSTHRNQPFRDYVKQKDRIFKDGVPTFLHHQTQSSLLETPDGKKSNLNFIGKVENIDEDWKTLCSMIDIPYVPMVRVQVRPHDHYTSFYDDDTVKIVTELYRRDFECFEYSKKLKNKTQTMGVEMKKNKHWENQTYRFGEMRDLINGSEIRHLQFSEFSEGHGSIYGTLNDGKKFKLHISEVLKMMDEFDFSVYDGSGDVLNASLKINWGSTNELKESTDFSHKADSAEYMRDGNTPNRINYVYKTGKGKDTTFKGYRTGPYYSGKLKITHPEDTKDNMNY